MTSTASSFGELLWSPSPERIETARITHLRQLAERRSGRSLPDFAALHRWSIESADDFWRLVAEDAHLRFSSPPSAGRASADMPGARWFPDAKLNYAEHCVKGGDPEATAIIAVDETGRERRWTFASLRRDVARCARALREAGVGPNDRVAAYATNCGEAVIALLASASIGALFTSSSPGFGVEATLDRFRQIRPKILFGSDFFFNNGKRSDISSRLAAIAEGLEGLERVVILPDESGTSSPDLQRWDAFLGDADGDLREAFAPLPFDHPIYVLYSSGTTGLPKGIVHGAGGALLKHSVELLYHCDVKRGDVVFYYTSCGWMMWNWLVSALSVGATIVLYEGGLVYPSREALWKLIGRYGVTHFGTSAPYIESCNRKGFRPSKVGGFETLRCVMSTGAPLTPPGFRWVYESVKQDVHLASISGGTDIVGCFVLGDPTRPVYAGEIQGPALGADIAVLDDDGDPIAGKPGELVCRNPQPSMPLRFWNDETGAMYRGAYFEKFPGVWHHGDWIASTEHGGFIIYGRSDATLKPGGVRIGTSDIYRPLATLPFVVESLAAAKRKTDGDIHIWLFVVLEEGHELDAKSRELIESTIRKQATPRHVPHRIIQVRELPRTRNGKLVETAVTRAINDEHVPNIESLANPAAFEELLVAVANVPPSTR